MCFVQVVKRLLPLAENVIEIELMKGNKGKLGYVMDSSINCDFFSQLRLPPFVLRVFLYAVLLVASLMDF